MLDKDYKLVRIIETITNNGEVLDLSSANGLYVSDNGVLYIADSYNQYVIVADSQGSVKKIITKPDSPIVPDNMEFKAKKVVEDDDGFIFVLCEGVYYRALVFNSKFEFGGALFCEGHYFLLTVINK